MLYLDKLFEDLCNFLDGKLRWGRRKGGKIRFTGVVLTFFERIAEQEANLYGEKEYLGIDYVIRNETETCRGIELAVEHENEFLSRDKDDFIRKEIQHLIDIKASNKVAITCQRICQKEKKNICWMK